MASFRKFFTEQLASNIKQSFFKIRIFLNKCKKKTLKEIAILFREKRPALKYNPKFDQWYEYVSDIIDTKIYKPSKNSDAKKSDALKMSA